MTNPEPEDDDEQDSSVPPSDRDATRDAGDSPRLRPDAAGASDESRSDTSDPETGDAKQELESIDRDDEDDEEGDADFTELEERQVQIAVVAARIAARSSESFSGLIPHPDDWDRYGDNWHERIVCMSEAFTTDESRRRDQIVTGMVEEAPKARRNALWLAAMSMILAFASGVLLDSPIVACAFLALPVMSMVQSFMGDRRRAKSKDEAEHE